MKFTEAGEPYYVDHVSKKTQWQHPAITGPQVTEMVTLFNILIKQILKKLMGVLSYLCCKDISIPCLCSNLKTLDRKL